MIPNLPILGIRFDIDKMYSVDDSTSYGCLAWLFFLKSIDIKKYQNLMFFEGDTNATPDRENVYCIAIQSVNQDSLNSIKLDFKESPFFTKIVANPSFIEGQQVFAEPLVDAGKIDSQGDFIPLNWSCKDALAKLINE